MPETKLARDKIMQWKEENGVSYQQIGTMIGKHKQIVYDAITGRNKSAESNNVLLKIIQIFDIK